VRERGDFDGALGVTTVFLTSRKGATIISLLRAVNQPISNSGGRNGFDGDMRLKMRVEDHDLVKKSGINLTADQELALAA